MRPAWYLTIICVALAGCIEVPGAVDEDHLARPELTLAGEAFPGLDTGGEEQQSQHFLVRAYGRGKAMQLADLAETAYQRVMVDTGLSNFQPAGGRYKVTVYAGPDEYRKKCGQPPWTRSVAVGSAVYSYEGGHVDAELSQRLAQMLFQEYLGPANQGNLALRWVQEGLADFEASKAGQPASGGSPPALRPWPAGWQPVPLDTFIHLAPASERDRATDAWYVQSQSMVRFMIERGGRLGFAQLLCDLRANMAFDKAIADAFPAGGWSSLSAFYTAWASAQ